MPTMFPDQVDALRELLQLDGAVCLDVAGDDHMSLRVAVYFRSDDADEDAPPASARWFSVSIAGTIREVAATPEGLAA